MVKVEVLNVALTTGLVVSVTVIIVVFWFVLLLESIARMVKLNTPPETSVVELLTWAVAMVF